MLKHLFLDINCGYAIFSAEISYLDYWTLEKLVIVGVEVNVRGVFLFTN